MKRKTWALASLALLLAAIAAISLTMFSLNFIGDGLRDALDPKMRT